MRDDYDHPSDWEPVLATERLKCPDCGIPTILDSHEDVTEEEALCDSCYRKREEREARILAAAPEMLNVLRQLSTMFHDCNDWRNAEKVDAAIAKAVGK